MNWRPVKYNSELALPLDLLPAWAFINFEIREVRDSKRAEIEGFRRECHRALNNQWEAAK